MSDDSTYANPSADIRLAGDAYGFFSDTNPFWSLWPYRTIRILLSGVFLWSGVAKLYDPLTFATIIEAYGIVPDGLTLPVAVALAGLEVLGAMGLLLDIRGSLGIIAWLLALFIMILSYGIWMGLDVDCGCFGPEDPEAKAFHGLRSALYRDLVMVIGIIYLYLWRYIRAAEPARIKNFLTMCAKRIGGKNETYA